MPRNQKSVSNDSAQLSVRCDAALKQRYSDVLDDEGDSMSDDLREHMEAVVARHDGASEYGTNDRLPDDDVLRRAYHVLDEYVDPDTRTIAVGAAESTLADKCNTPKRVVRERIIKPLDDRGLIRPNWGELVVARVEQ